MHLITDTPVDIEVTPPLPIPEHLVWEWKLFIQEYPRAWYRGKTPLQMGEQAYADFTDMKSTKDLLFYERIR